MTYADVEMYEDDAEREAELFAASEAAYAECATNGCDVEDGICERCGTVYEYEAETRDPAEYEVF